MRNKKVIEKQKTKAMVTKQYKAREKISLSNKGEDENNTKNTMDLN